MIIPQKIPTKLVRKKNNIELTRRHANQECLSIMNEENINILRIANMSMKETYLQLRQFTFSKISSFSIINHLQFTYDEEKVITTFLYILTNIIFHWQKNSHSSKFF